MFVSQHDESAVEPVLVVLWPALWRALLPHDVIGLDHGGHEVVRPDLPPGGEGRRPRELGARVAVVADGVPLGPRPDVPVSGCNHVIGTDFVSSSCTKYLFKLLNIAIGGLITFFNSKKTYRWMLIL